MFDPSGRLLHRHVQQFPCHCTRKTQYCTYLPSINATYISLVLLNIFSNILSNSSCVSAQEISYPAWDSVAAPSPVQWFPAPLYTSAPHTGSHDLQHEFTVGHTPASHVNDNRTVILHSPERVAYAVGWLVPGRSAIQEWAVFVVSNSPIPNPIGTLPQAKPHSTDVTILFGPCTSNPARINMYAEIFWHWVPAIPTEIIHTRDQIPTAIPYLQEGETRKLQHLFDIATHLLHHKALRRASANEQPSFLWQFCIQAGRE